MRCSSALLSCIIGPSKLQAEHLPAFWNVGIRPLSGSWRAVLRGGFTLLVRKSVRLRIGQVIARVWRAVLDHFVSVFLLRFCTAKNMVRRTNRLLFSALGRPNCPSSHTPEGGRHMTGAAIVPLLALLKLGGLTLLAAYAAKKAREAVERRKSA